MWKWMCSYGPRFLGGLRALPTNIFWHRCEQLWLGGEEGTQRNRERQHPLTHRHARDDVIDRVRSGLCHAPGAARRAKPASLAGEGDQLLMRALGAAQTQKAMSEDAAFEECVKLLFDKLG